MLDSFSMKVSLIALFILLNMSASFADAVDLFNAPAGGDNYRLLCHYSYERIEASELQQETVVAYGLKNDNGSIEFDTTVRGLSAYSFYQKGHDSIPQVRWHYDSKISINVILEETGLIKYRYQFYNYIQNAIQSVFDETREVYKPGINYLNEAAFNYYEGNLIESEVNVTTWVNERGISLDKCRIDAY